MEDACAGSANVASCGFSPVETDDEDTERAGDATEHQRDDTTRGESRTRSAMSQTRCDDET
jgi:hypothetical protein